MKKLLALAGMALVLSLGANKVAAQGGPGGGGGFDLAQMQKMVLDNLREQFDVKDDGEWKVIGDQIQKVMDARMQVGFGGGAGMARMFRRPNSNGSQDGGNGQGGGRRGGMFGGASNPEAD
ncbi:MAG: hypothetical protein JWR26_1120, partial [Pedosphaera sp.]|nr:hypothetical protein [Pedosphaera sp.]